MALRTIKLGVVAAALSEDPREVARQARVLGFTGVQFHARTGSLDLVDLSASGRREFRQVLSSQDRELVGLRADLGPRGLGPGADVDKVVQQLDHIMQAATGLMAPLVCIDLGTLPEPLPKAKAKPKVTPEQAGLILLPTAADRAEIEPPPARPPTPADLQLASQVNEAMRELGRRADRYNVMLALRSELASFTALEQVLQQADCPWFGIDLDPVSMLRDDWPADEIFSRLGSFIRHVRGRDAVGGADKRTRPALIGQGSTNWQQLQADLEAADYQGWITIDPLELTDRVAGAGAGLDHLKFL